jgi:hypothetical protein
MARSTRSPGQGSLQASYDFVHEQKLLDLRIPTDDVHSIVEHIVTAGAQILYTRYIESQKIPYASRTLARELVLNASWSSIALDCASIFAEPDDDLLLPPIDEWAGGVLPVRDADVASLRCSVTPPREMRKSITLHRSQVLTPEMTDQKPPPRPTIPRSAGPRPSSQARRKKAPPVVTEAERITQVFDEARKRTNVAMKAVTVDSDFSVIQINEPKGLPPTLIVPKVTVKPKPPPKQQTVTAARPVRTAPVRTPAKRKRKPPSILLAPDMPVFDEELTGISYSDKFVCVPGVTFRDGQVVKTRPPLVNNTQMTRSQYESYLEEMKRSGEEPSK